jgi:hypothetical protein
VKTAGVDLFDVPVALPLDVYEIGFTQLTAVGFTAEQQREIYIKWIFLSESKKESWTSQWNALDQDDASAVSNFVQTLVAAPSACQAASSTRSASTSTGQWATR